MSTSMTMALGAATVLLAAARALEQLLQFRRITGATAGPISIPSASLLAPTAGAMTLMYADIVGADSALMVATWISTLSSTAAWASTTLLIAAHSSAAKAADSVACGDES